MSSQSTLPENANNAELLEILLRFILKSCISPNLIWAKLLINNSGLGATGLFLPLTCSPISNPPFFYVYVGEKLKI